MLLKEGDKLLIVHRRLFNNDKSRFFIGQVLDYQAGLVKIKGNTYARNPHTTVVVRKNDQRIKLISLLSGTFIVYQLDSDIDLVSLTFTTDTNGSFLLKEGNSLIMDLTEYLFEEINTNRN